MDDQVLDQIAADLWGAFRSGLGYEANMDPRCFAWAHARYVGNVSKPERLKILSTVNHDLTVWTLGCMRKVGEKCQSTAVPREANDRYAPYVTLEAFKKACIDEENGEGLVCG